MAEAQLTEPLDRAAEKGGFVTAALSLMAAEPSRCTTRRWARPWFRAKVL